MKHHYLLNIVFGMLCFGLAPAVFSCPQPEVNVTVSATLDPVRYDYTQSDWKANVGGDLAGSTQIRLVPHATTINGCTVLQGLDIEIRNQANIRVSSKYQQDSCEFLVIKAHEEKHLRVLQEYFANTTPMQQFVANALRGNTGVPVGQTAMLTQKLQSASSQLQAMIQEQHKKAQYDQVDAPSLVSAEQSACQHW